MSTSNTSPTDGHVYSCFRMTHRALRRWLFCLLILLTASTRSGYAQRVFDDSFDPVSTPVREAHTLHVSPHLVVFTPSRTATILTFANRGTTPMDAAIVVQFGYPYYPATDTALFPAHWRWQDQFPRDTVVAAPGPHDRSASQWLSGVPTHLTLQPHEIRRVTLRIAPPANLATGEYHARILTLVSSQPKHGHGSRDTKTKYIIPLASAGPRVLRDSVRVFFRTGPQVAGIKVTQAEAQLDTTGEGEGAGFRDPVRILVRLHLTGTAHFEGAIRILCQREDGTGTFYYDTPVGNTEVLYTDATLRILADSRNLDPGRYSMVVTLTPWQDEFPPAQRIFMRPVQVSIPVEIPSWRGW